MPLLRSPGDCPLRNNSVGVGVGVGVAGPGIGMGVGVAVGPGVGVEDISTGMLDTLPLSPLAFTVSGPDEVQGIAGEDDEP